MRPPGRGAMPLGRRARFSPRSACVGRHGRSSREGGNDPAQEGFHAPASCASILARTPRQGRMRLIPETPTSEATAQALAQAAGLDRAWAEHRADVEEAVAGLARLRAGLARPRDPAAEP